MTQPQLAQPGPRRGRSNVAKFWIGVALCLPVLFLVGALESLPTVVGDAVNLPGEVSAIATFGLNIGLLAAFVLGLVRESTRFVVVGIIAGVAILFVLAAGACIALLAGVGQGY
jgi:hypothetical protein